MIWGCSPFLEIKFECQKNRRNGELRELTCEVVLHALRQGKHFAVTMITLVMSIIGLTWGSISTTWNLFIEKVDWILCQNLSNYISNTTRRMRVEVDLCFFLSWSILNDRIAGGCVVETGWQTPRTIFVFHILDWYVTVAFALLCWGTTPATCSRGGLCLEEGYRQSNTQGIRIRHKKEEKKRGIKSHLRVRRLVVIHRDVVTRIRIRTWSAVRTVRGIEVAIIFSVFIDLNRFEICGTRVGGRFRDFPTTTPWTFRDVCNSGRFTVRILFFSSHKGSHLGPTSRART